MLGLLKRKAAFDFNSMQDMVGGEFTIWIEHAGVEVAITGVGGRFIDDGAAMAGMGFLRKPMSACSVMIRISDIPTGYVFREAARFYASPTGTRATAKQFKVDSTEEQAQLSTHILLNGSKGR